ncbi:hypothetical protein DFA_00076 [Cavenderia fasciculata]|uniref:Uncharacterized protein n=1 Tax=Cavenderia fasciculata TaxID=261658 RepID=F4PXI9_CACFS|nr:uncharacterized protein DFA_00076 [Cavenderia fasciculata]EGG19499.1 hypothetical protein DFA_00076 [Cavenderia fasciculata]|eukprot:XP_004357793.1 hypothetical protein DFA_00076 [Cavenderia fasciculata]
MLLEQCCNNKEYNDRLRVLRVNVLVKGQSVQTCQTCVLSLDSVAQQLEQITSTGSFDSCSEICSELSNSTAVQSTNQCLTNVANPSGNFGLVRTQSFPADWRNYTFTAKYQLFNRINVGQFVFNITGDNWTPLLSTSSYFFDAPKAKGYKQQWVAYLNSTTFPQGDAFELTVSACAGVCASPYQSAINNLIDDCNKEIREKIYSTFNFKEICTKSITPINEVASIVGIDITKESDHSLKWNSIYTYYRYMFAANSFDHRYIAHMNTRHVDLTTTTDPLPFNNYVNAKDVWWFDVGNMFTLPIGNYRVYWMVKYKFSGWVDVWHQIEDGDYKSEKVTTRRHFNKNDDGGNKWTYFDGGLVIPDKSMIGKTTTTTMSVHAKLTNVDSSHKSGFYVAFALFVPIEKEEESIIHTPNILCKTNLEMINKKKNKKNKKK